ncbi:MAG: hypothetical protein WC774_05070 [Candidatus Gracilibacteria bacterium]
MITKILTAFGNTKAENYINISGELQTWETAAFGQTQTPIGIVGYQIGDVGNDILSGTQNMPERLGEVLSGLKGQMKPSSGILAVNSAHPLFSDIRNAEQLTELVRKYTEFIHNGNIFGIDERIADFTISSNALSREGFEKVGSEVGIYQQKLGKIITPHLNLGRKGEIFESRSMILPGNFAGHIDVHHQYKNPNQVNHISYRFLSGALRMKKQTNEELLAEYKKEDPRISGCKYCIKGLAMVYIGGIR